MSISGFHPARSTSRPPGPTLSIPPRDDPAPRPGVPWLAATVPVVGALGFWAFTGSVFALWFAALGPLIAVAGVMDGRRTARRHRRDTDRAADAVRGRVRARVADEHDRERAELRTRHPDVAGFLGRRDQIWRPVPERDGVVVIGNGDAESSTRVTVAADPHPDDAALADDARALRDAPVVAPLGTGTAVVGPEALATAVVRGLVLQLALAHAPGRIEFEPAPSTEEWVAALPHSAVAADTRVVIGRSGDALPPGDVLIVHAAPGEPLPPRCGLVLTLTSISGAHAEVGAHGRTVTVEAVGRHQALAIAGELAERARAAQPRGDDRGPVTLASLRPAERRGARLGLVVAIGRGAGGAAFEIDIVRDGPHAVVTGMTGAGKSELLVSWVLALCAAYRTDDVAFLLADFKGGTAFEPLASLPHVTGVITDLDPPTARRAIESLRAEIRHREAVLARAAARDVADVALPRLIIVVDEFAALRETQPELEALFADIAARGRALGMHLVLGSQRAAGVLRDALLANCALRICLRVADRMDSRAVIGTDEAAELGGGDDARGAAMIRRSADVRPARVRVALSAPDDLAAAVVDAGPQPRAPWLPALPPRIELADLRDDQPGLVLGLVDDPEHQRQSPWRLPDGDRGLLVVGGAGSGKTTAMHTLAAQVPASSLLWIDPDPERAWDAIIAAAAGGLAPGATVFIDDLDAVTTRLPDDYARVANEAIERLVRDAGRHGIRVIAAAQRLTGVAGRVADLFPRRLILVTASRADHIAAGGEAAGAALCTGPGRGVIGSLAVQVAVSTPWEACPAPTAPVWEPPPGVSGFVTRRASSAVLERWERTGVRLRSIDDHADASDPEPGGRVVLVGAPEQWLARPRLCERVRTGAGLVVEAGVERDLRMLTGERSLPPYADPLRGRAWYALGDAGVRRVTVDPGAGT